MLCEVRLVAARCYGRLLPPVVWCCVVAKARVLLVLLVLVACGHTTPRHTRKGTAAAALTALASLVDARQKTCRRGEEQESCRNTEGAIHRRINRNHPHQSQPEPHTATHTSFGHAMSDGITTTHRQAGGRAAEEAEEELEAAQRARRRVWSEDDEFEVEAMFLATKVSGDKKAGDRGRKGETLYYLAWKGFLG